MATDYTLAFLCVKDTAVAITDISAVSSGLVEGTAVVHLKSGRAIDLRAPAREVVDKLREALEQE